MAKMAIYGAGAQGRVALATVRAAGLHDVVAFLDDDRRKYGKRVDGLLIVKGELSNQFSTAFVAVGDNEARCRLADRLETEGLVLVNVIHPSAVVMPSIRMDRGILVCAGAVVVAGTTIEDAVVVNTGATVDHDCLLKRGCYLSPGVHTAGRVIVGEKAFVGVGASLGPNVVVGEGAMVGAGAAVLKSVDPYTFVAGVPAEFVKEVRH